MFSCAMLRDPIRKPSLALTVEDLRMCGNKGSGVNGSASNDNGSDVDGSCVNGHDSVVYIHI